jgi:CAAX protease family protein
VSSNQPLAPQLAPRSWALSPEPEPIFGLGTVWAVLLSMLIALIVCGAAAVAMAPLLPAFAQVRTVDLAQDPRVLLPAQLAAYGIVLAGLARYFGHLGIGFRRALHWRWPEHPALFLVAGAIVGMLLQFVANLLPSPPELPIDKMLRTPTDAWLMAAFGVLFAPFAEEVFFRGLLFPALSRRAGAILGLLATALLFGAVHAQQLGEAWSQVACIVAVGAVLTLVRWRYHSLASSTLMHMGYNAALFATLFAQTHGFRQLPA